MIFCTACGAEADDQATFCDQCGQQLVAALPRVCAECGHRNRAAARFCAACGTRFPVITPAPREPAPVEQIESPVTEVAPVPEIAPPAEEEPVTVPPSTPPRLAPVEAPPVEPEPPHAEPVTPVAAITAEPAVPRSAAVEAAARPLRPAGQERRPPPPSSKPFSESAREWAASRQADILLYLGAFLLVAAALLFVSSQGEELTPELRVALLVTYTLGFTLAGILAQRNPKIREAGMVFLAIGALITPLNFILIYTELLEDRDVSPDLVWLIGSIYSTLFYALLWQRGYGRLYAVPAALSGLSTWAALAAVLNIPDEWLGTWWIVFAFGATVVTDRLNRYSETAAWLGAAILALILVAQLAISDPFEEEAGRIALTASLALITAWFSFTGWSLRQPLLLPCASTAAIATGLAGTAAAELDADWGAYSPLAIGFLAVYTRRWWTGWHLGVARLGWLYAAVCGVSPLAFVAFYETGAHGAVSFLLGAAILGSIAWRDSVDGVRLFEAAERGTPTELAERTLFGWAGFVLMLIGVAYTQRELAIEAPDTCWSYLAIGLVPIAFFAWKGRTSDAALPMLVPPAILAMLVSLPDPGVYPGHVAICLGAPTVAYLGSFATTRQWPVTLIASVTGGFAMAAAWDALGWTAWTLAIAFSAIGVALFAVLTPLRTYRPGVTPSIVTILSWCFVVLGPIVAFGALLWHYDPDVPGLRRTPEYRTGLYLLLLAAPLIAYEGWRFKNWTITAAATTLAALVIAPLWTSYDWPVWTLALTYLAVGLVRFVSMAPVRDYRNTPQQLSIIVLSWGLTLAAPITAFIALTDRMNAGGGTAVEMVEYRTLIATVLAHVPLLLFEARRLRIRWALVTGSVVAMAALLLTIATFQIDDVQAYTVPVGLYMIIFGLITRRSTLLLDPHLMLHEFVLLAGVATILGPQARLGLQPDGAGWGGVILGEGLVFLLVGLVLGSRWLTVSGVLSISGVAIRWLAVNTGDTIPYWVTLGGVGMALLILGTALLLARDRWIAFRDATIEWWGRSATLRGVDLEASVVAAPVAVIVIAFIASAFESWVEPLVS